MERDRKKDRKRQGKRERRKGRGKKGGEKRKYLNKRRKPQQIRDKENRVTKSDSLLATVQMASHYTFLFSKP
jgi:hypothetical protein